MSRIPVVVKVVVRDGFSKKEGGLWHFQPPEDWEGKYLEIRAVNHMIPKDGRAQVVCLDEEDT